MDTRTLELRVEFDEDADRTDARVSTDIGGRRCEGWGRARKHPSDPPVVQIGEELALARALADLSDQLLDVAARSIGEREGHEVVLGR
jgi:hypothetical protein